MQVLVEAQAHQALPTTWCALSTRAGLTGLAGSPLQLQRRIVSGVAIAASVLVHSITMLSYLAHDVYARSRG